LFRVSKLKISGFKSFAFPTEFVIDDGVTGVIGPNGCGKSNIFEAIRWVMGESSSKSLRSTSMDEVIFNGTANFPAKNLAEVSIELENFSGQIASVNTKENKLIVSRTLERGVGSFYKINNKEVRARDVNILFSDAGSGPRSSSIISQGNIDQIINFKPIERKIILEDAAGVSGLQARRRESELKLHSTEQNLEKIEINLNGLIEQKKTLSRQVRQVERYEKLSDSISVYESILVFEIWKKAIKIIEQSSELRKNLNSKLNQFISDIEMQKKGISKNKFKLQKLGADRGLLNEQYFEYNKQENNLDNKINNLNSKKSEIRAFLNTVNNDLLSEEKRKVELNNELNNLQKKLVTSSSISELEEVLKKDIKEEHKLKKELKELEAAFVNEMQLSLGEAFKSDNLKETKENLEENKKNLEKSIIKNMADLSDLQKKIDQENNRQNIENKKTQDIKKKIFDKKKKIEELNEKKISQNKILNELNESIRDLSDKYTRYQTEITTLKNISGQKLLSKDSVVNLLKISKGYEDAVYAALMYELDAKIGDTSEKGIAKVSKKVTPINNSLLKFLKVPKELELILSQIGFVSDTSNITQKQKNLQVGQTLVDIKGNIWRWDGFMSKENLQQKKIIDSKLKIVSLNNNSNKIQEILINVRKKKENNLIKEKEIFDSVKKENQDIENLYSDLELGTKQILKLNESKSSLINNYEYLNSKINSLKDSQKKNELDILEIMKKEKVQNKSVQGNTHEAQIKIDKLNKRIEEVASVVASTKEKLIGMQLDFSYSKDNLDRISKLRDESTTRIKVLVDRKKSYLEEEIKLDSYPKKFELELKSVIAKRNEVKKLVDDNEFHIQQMESEIKEREKTFSKINICREEEKNKLIKLESNVEIYKNNEKELREKLFNKTKKVPEDFEKVLKEKNYKNQNTSEIENQIKKFMFQREQLGAVNLRAKIEENEISAIIEDIEIERNDLVDAVHKLRLGINKINQEGKNRLVTAFEKVEKNFSELFKKLFDGGHAKLELVKSDDPLQTGIEIYARPPGKKLSSINLLSGGEKTLTAIALIFSIFLINPSPLCILDEVDAALDDENVVKFCRILKELTTNTETRFLIVTHHKITMTSIDRVYGVTMAKKGISDIVSVDFQNKKFKEAV